MIQGEQLTPLIARNDNTEMSFFIRKRNCKAQVTDLDIDWLITRIDIPTTPKKYHHLHTNEVYEAKNLFIVHTPTTTKQHSFCKGDLNSYSHPVRNKELEKLIHQNWRRGSKISTQKRGRQGDNQNSDPRNGLVLYGDRGKPRRPKPQT